MDRKKKLSFHEEMEREARKIEEELKAHPEVDDVTVSSELDDALFKQIQAYENEQKHSTGETKKKTIKFPRNKKFLFTFVAVVTLMCAMGVTSIGSKSYRKQVDHGVYGTQKVQKVNVDDMERQESSENGEIFAFQEVEKMIGMVPVIFTERPDEMEYVRYKIIPEEQRAKIFYRYGDDMIRYDIYKNESNSSLGQNQEDKLLEETKLTVEEELIGLKQYEIEATHEKYWIMSFKYKDINYQLKGKIEEEEIKKIAKNLKFL